VAETDGVEVLEDLDMEGREVKPSVHCVEYINNMSHRKECKVPLERLNALLKCINTDDMPAGMLAVLLNHIS
jgi:hypothetical protein